MIGGDVGGRYVLLPRYLLPNFSGNSGIKKADSKRQDNTKRRPPAAPPPPPPRPPALADGNNNQQTPTMDGDDVHGTLKLVGLWIVVVVVVVVSVYPRSFLFS